MALRSGGRISGRYDYDRDVALLRVRNGVRNWVSRVRVGVKEVSFVLVLFK